MLGDNFLLNFLLDELKSIPSTTKKNEGRNKLKGLRYIYQNEKRKQNRPTEQNKSLSMYNIRPSIELINPGRNLESDIKHLTWSTDISGIRNKDGCIKSMTAEKISSQLPEFKQYTIKSFIPVIVSPSYQPSTNLLRFIFNLLLSPSSRNEEERKELGNKKILFKDGAFLAQKKFNKTGLANFLKIATTKFFLAPKGFKNIGGNRYAKQATPLIFMYFFTAIVGIRRTYHSIEGSKNFSMGNSYSSLVDPETKSPTSPPIVAQPLVGDVVSPGALLKNARGAGDSETNQRQEQKIELFEIAQESNFFSVLDENLYQFLRLTDYITKIFVIWAFHNFVTRPALGKNSLGGSKREISDSNQARIIWPVMSLFELISNRFSFLLFISNYLNKKRMEFLPTNSSPEIETENPKFIQNKRRIFGEQKKQKEVKGLARLQAIQSFEPILEILLLSLKKEEQVRDSKNIFNSPKGYLFVGPPGTGKTLLAQAIAEEAAVPLICLSASEIQKQIEIGTRIGALRLRKLFDQARKLAPCILFLDEIDSIGGARFTALDPQKSFNIVGELEAAPPLEHPKFGSDSRAGDAVTSDENTGHWSPRLYHERDCVRLRHQEGVSDVVSESEYYSQKRLYEDQKSPQSPQDGGLFTEFLIQMDSFSIKDRFVVIGTTNNLSSLDSAFIRAGRFDRILGFTYPSKKARIDILKFYSKKFFQTKQGPNINLSSSPDIREPVNKLLTHSVSPNEVSWNYFGKYTNGFSPAHLSRLVNEARLYSISRNKKEKKVSFENLQQGFNRITKPK